MKFEKFIINENLMDKTKSLLQRLDITKTLKFLKSEFDVFVDEVRNAGIEDEVVSLINKYFGTRYRSLSQIERQTIRESKEVLNEDLAHWWEVVKSEAFPTLAFYPALTIWLDIDKLFAGQDINIKKTVIYASMWILLVSGKYLNGWLKWKKQNQEVERIST